MRRIILAIVIVVVVLAGFFAYPLIADRIERTHEIAKREHIEVPSAQPKVPEAQARTRARKPPGASEVNWDVPFTPQAPLGEWDALHEEACEEASALMVLRYFQGKPLTSPEDAETGIKFLVEKSEKVLGQAVDQTAQQIAELIASETVDRTLTISVVANPTEESIKHALDQGMLLIVPAAGRQLHNPYFQRPGPLYHMLVIRGYTKDGFAITNDPGTKRGKEFLYTWPTLLAAIHDWNDGDVDNGDKVAIVVGPYVP